MVDLYGTGTLSLEALSTAPAEAFAVPSALATSAPPSAYASAPPPAQPRKPTVLRVAAGIITDETGRTLLVRKVGSSAFMQAGGKIEPGESALDALSRELREEIGLELDPDLTEYLGSFRAVAANEPDTVIRAEVFALVTTGDFAASGEIEELVWIEDPVSHGLELAELTRDTILPLWVERRSALF
ncbi:MAG TPA: NUDIX domain-containing protein [Rhodoglobus sp.]|nr:NUDIX domain-containing protein [Rhodoglobus sp.]HOY81835.1 NUDIX domain-containing protein [Rhodoglobus sp.]HQA22740.1 NUDIX domain-containing protein [Rhodoglobus sp.]HQI65943.1 NUDIX domain-containing protein [Rhodoglobus sp.]HQJ34505.1 NUDIX domain-containing protein [Rhodoglobus sp.]